MVNMVKTGENMVESGAGAAGLIPARFLAVNFYTPKRNLIAIMNMSDNKGMAKNNHELTPAELAGELGVSVMTVSRWRKAGMPFIDRKTYKAGKHAARPRYDLEQVKAWLASRTAAT